MKEPSDLKAKAYLVMYFNQSRDDDRFQVLLMMNISINDAQGEIEMTKGCIIFAWVTNDLFSCSPNK